jgi:phospholipid/cholesterol/gamma-HCH transport system substrate-binding protein
MRLSRSGKTALAAVLVVCLIAAGTLIASGTFAQKARTHLVGYFANSNGVFVGDDVMILGVAVGKIDKIEAQPEHAKISFYVSDKYKVPADANAVVISPTLVTARAIQLTPAYKGGPALQNGAVIPQQRTAVPVEYDDLRKQLEKLTESLQPTKPGGVSTLGAFINTAADNLRGNGANIRESLIQVSQAFSALGDHSNDIFSTLKNLSILVSALQSSTDLMRELNSNLAAVTGLLANDPAEIDNAVRDLNTAVSDVKSFIADNREALGTTTDKLASITQAVTDSLDDLKQTLHITPTAFANYINIYEPANASLTGSLAANNVADPISFICGAIQAASRLGNAQSAKLCVQYLAPIVKNRQYNFPPLGFNPIVGAQARPNEVTFSEDWLRPLTEPGRVRDFYEGPLNPPAPPPEQPPPLPAEAPTPLATDTQPTDPAAGLPGMMLPAGGGS